MIDQTHDAALRSWVDGADGHPEFPIQNLPLGVFTPPGGGELRGGVAIGDRILDLAEALKAGLLQSPAAHAAAAAPLNGFLALGSAARKALRQEVSALLRNDSPAADRARALGERLVPLAADCRLALPSRIGDYTDFYAGIHHAENVGRLFRPDNPLMPNYKHVPIGYHGRSSSVRVSGEPVVRPSGQTKAPDADSPTFGASRRLDIELELGVWIGQGNPLGEPTPIAEAGDHIAGYCLLNDWSARDIQPWEYQPLGPFLSKNFMTTVSPWVVTPEALAPFRIAQAPRPEGDPSPLPYLLDQADQAEGALDLRLEVDLTTPAMRRDGLAPFRLCTSSTRHLYWTPAQLVAHHTCNGCGLNPGDLLGSGTISGSEQDSFGSLLERSFGGKQPITLPNGEVRTFLEDGDEIVMRAHAERPGFSSIGFGECRGQIVGSKNEKV
jgi:fumarylacetoacetase